jgi:hypothetical protein
MAYDLLILNGTLVTPAARLFQDVIKRSRVTRPGSGRVGAAPGQQ